MKRRIVFVTILALVLVSLCAAASADITICDGYDRAEFRIGLPTERPDGGGFFSRGIQFSYGINGIATEPAAGTQISWIVAPQDGGPGLSLTPDTMGHGSARVWLNLHPSETYTADRTYDYRITMIVNGTRVTRDVAITFVNDALPTGYGLTVAPVDLTSSTASLGAAVRMTGNEISMTTENYYVVTTVVDGTNLSYQTNERGWSDTEWEEHNHGDDARFLSLNIDYSISGFYKAKKPGIYDRRHVVASFFKNTTNGSNLACYIPYTLKLYDANGNLPGPSLDTPEREVTWYTGLPEACPDNGGAYSFSSVGQMWFPDDKRDYNDLNVQWSLVYVSGPDNFELCYEPNNDWQDSYFYAEAKPKSGAAMTAGTSLYTMKATYKGVTYEGQLTIHTADLAQPPTGMTLRWAEFNPATGIVGNYTGTGNDGVITIRKGKTYAITGDLTGNAPGNPDDYWFNIWTNDGMTSLDRWDYKDALENPIFGSRDAVAEGNVPGTYTIGADLSLADSNLAVAGFVTLQVEDENGNMPDAVLTLRTNFDSPINRYLGLTREIEERDGVFSWNALCDAEIEKDVYRDMKDQYGGEPSWTVVQTAGDPLPFTWDVEKYEDDRGEWERADVRLEAQDLMDANYRPGSAEITITCAWGGQTVTSVTQVHIKNLPNGRPSGISYNNGLDVVECSVGDVLEIRPTILPAKWKGIPPFASKYAYNSGEFEAFCDIQSQDDSGRTVKTKKAGIFRCFVGVNTDTVTAGRWITYRVKDEHGQIPVPEFDISRNRDSDEITLYIGMELEEGVFYNSRPQTEPQVDHFYVRSRGGEDLSLYWPDNRAAWTVTRIQGTAELRMDTGWDGEPFDMDLVLKKLPDAPENAVYRITFDWGDRHWEKTVTIHFENSPTGMPTGIETDFGNVLIVRTGERIGMNDRVSFKDGWSIPGYPLEASIGGAENWQEGVTHDENWNWDIAGKPGIYDCNVSKNCANVRWFEDFTLVVTDEDGTLNSSLYTPVGRIWKLPENTKTVESEAFAGTQIRQIDIPDTVTGIAPDAFEGCGLFAVYTHGQWAVDWAWANGLVPLAD